MTDWMDMALCTQVDPELFFPKKGQPAKVAKGVCDRCEVRAQCLQHALDLDLRVGVFGGFTERERRPMHKNYRRDRVA